MAEGEGGERSTLTICQGHRKPQEGGVDLETEKCIKKSIMKLLNILQLFPSQLIQLCGSHNYSR